MKTIGLFDADWIAFQMAAACQKRHRWPDGIWTLEVDENEVAKAIDDRIEYLRKEISCRKENVYMFLSGTDNWRKHIMPSYKSNRDSINNWISRPMILDYALQYIRDNYQFFQHDMLEADDLMGIYATNPEWHGDDKKVIVAIDKDMKSIPAWHYTPDKDFAPWLQSEAEADVLYYKQWLMGDRTDGYEGCQGIGEKTALDLAVSPVLLIPTNHEFKSGARKGQVEVRWKKTPTGDRGACVASHYAKAGHTSEECYQNGMVARILRHGEFCFKTNTVLFTPH
ncbi:hypothetical protein ACSL9D_000305 [Vibrio alginolyticus]